MTAATQISVDEYLKTSYRPDCDYVEGEVRESNLGEYEHSRPLMHVIGFFGARENEWRILVLPGQRIRVRPDRFRIADVRPMISLQGRHLRLSGDGCSNI